MSSSYSCWSQRIRRSFLPSASRAFFWRLLSRAAGGGSVGTGVVSPAGRESGDSPSSSLRSSSSGRFSCSRAGSEAFWSDRRLRSPTSSVEILSTWRTRSLANCSIACVLVLHKPSRLSRVARWKFWSSFWKVHQEMTRTGRAENSRRSTSSLVRQLNRSRFFLMAETSRVRPGRSPSGTARPAAAKAAARSQPAC